MVNIIFLASVIDCVRTECSLGGNCWLWSGLLQLLYLRAPLNVGMSHSTVGRFWVSLNWVALAGVI